MVSRPDDQDFLSRWSARKLRARAEGAPEPAPPEAPRAEPPMAEPAPEKTDAEILQELGLPDPGNLVKGDDFRAFLRDGIPAGLRSRALRRLWLSDPLLANLDGLNDYEQDFTDKATVRPDLKTAYRVGKGFLRDAPPAAAADAEDEPKAPPVEAAGEHGAAERGEQGAPPETEPEESSPVEARTAATAGPADVGDAVTGAPAEPGSRRRRMRFTFG